MGLRCWVALTGAAGLMTGMPKRGCGGPGGRVLGVCGVPRGRKPRTNEYAVQGAYHCRYEKRLFKI